MYPRVVPMFMDRHDGVDLTPDEMANAHPLDLEVQARYDVSTTPTGTTRPRARSSASSKVRAGGRRRCAPRGACRVRERDHRASGGDAARVLSAAFRNQTDDRATIAPATRAIVFTDMCGSVAQTHQLGDEAHVLVREHDGLFASSSPYTTVARSSTPATGSWRLHLGRLGGRVRGRGAACRQARNERDDALDVSIGISAGEPVTDDNDDLFGAAVQLAARLCARRAARRHRRSVAVRELCIGKPFDSVTTAGSNSKGAATGTELCREMAMTQAGL